MSSPKPVLNPRIKISKTGRPYVDVADLVKTELDRIEKSQGEAKNGTMLDNAGPNSNTTNPTTANNGSKSCER